MFTQGFGSTVLDNERIRCEVDGFQCIAWTERDNDYRAPDKECDGFWPSLDPKDDGWIGDKTEAELAAAQVKAKRVMRAWRNDEWDWCGVVVEVRKAGVRLTERYAHALWGVERNCPDSDNSYLMEVANELLPGALAAARVRLAEVVEALTADLPPTVPDVWDRIKREAASGKGA